MLNEHDIDYIIKNCLHRVTLGEVESLTNQQLLDVFKYTIVEVIEKSNDENVRAAGKFV